MSTYKIRIPFEGSYWIGNAIPLIFNAGSAEFHSDSAHKTTELTQNIPESHQKLFEEWVTLQGYEVL